MGWEVVGHLPAAVRFSGPLGAFRALQARVPAELWPTRSTAGHAFDEWFALNPIEEFEAVDGALRTAWTSERVQWRYSLPELGHRLFEHRNTAVVFRLRRRGPALELVACGSFGDHSAAALDRTIGAAVRATRASYGLRLGSPAWARATVPLPGGGPVLTWRGVGQHTKPSPDQWALTMGDIELF